MLRHPPAGVLAAGVARSGALCPVLQIGRLWCVSCSLRLGHGSSCLLSRDSCSGEKKKQGGKQGGMSAAGRLRRVPSEAHKR